MADDLVGTASDTEKITINLTPVDLGKIDLLVAEGIFHNRTDLIRAGIRRVLDEHTRLIDEKVTAHRVSIGMSVYSRKALERARDEGKRLRIRVIGRCSIADDVTPDLAAATIETLTVYGSLKASKQVLDAIGRRRLVLLSGSDDD